MAAVIEAPTVVAASSTIRVTPSNSSASSCGSVRSTESNCRGWCSGERCNWVLRRPLRLCCIVRDSLVDGLVILGGVLRLGLPSFHARCMLPSVPGRLFRRGGRLDNNPSVTVVALIDCSACLTHNAVVKRRWPYIKNMLSLTYLF